MAHIAHFHRAAGQDVLLHVGVGVFLFWIEQAALVKFLVVAAGAPVTVVPDGVPGSQHDEQEAQQLLRHIGNGNEDRRPRGVAVPAVVGTVTGLAARQLDPLVAELVRVSLDRGDETLRLAQTVRVPGTVTPGIAGADEVGATVLGVEEIGVPDACRGRQGAAGVARRIRAESGLGIRIRNAEVPARHAQSRGKQKRTFEIVQRHRWELRLVLQRTTRNFHAPAEASRTPPEQRTEQRELGGLLQQCIPFTQLGCCRRRARLCSEQRTWFAGSGCQQACEVEEGAAGKRRARGSVHAIS